MNNAPRCQAKNRAGKSCRSPAVRGKRVCRLHGGKSPGAPKGEANGAYVHGNRTKEAIAMRRAAGRLLKAIAGEQCL
ncbi:HGGxSTG domain-containing protein [Sphingomonas sp.]|uniref:HGGxSTG domain-containing protein n=1 Tax=Sphingomonas sp. TaxID=28214 RepID=UPI003BAA5CB3